MTSAVCRPPQQTMRYRIDSTELSSSDELSLEPAPSTTRNYRSRTDSSESLTAPYRKKASLSDSLDSSSTHSRRSIDDFRARRKESNNKDSLDSGSAHSRDSGHSRLSIDEFRALRKHTASSSTRPSTTSRSSRSSYKRDSDEASVYSMDDARVRSRSSASVYSGNSSVSSRRSTDTVSRCSTASSTSGPNSVDLYLASKTHRTRRREASGGGGSSGDSVSSRRSLDENRLRSSSRDRSGGDSRLARHMSSSSSVRDTTDHSRRTVRGGKRYGASTCGAASVSSLPVRRPQSIPEAPPTIEVAPGVTARLRGAKESYECVKHDFFLPTKCFCCSLELFCIMDASYVLCPTCKVVGPLGEGDGDMMGSNGGVALGITSDVLLQWQSEISRDAMNNMNGRMR